MIIHKDASEISKVLKKYKLLEKKEEEWRSTKKVGSLLGDEEGISRRKQSAQRQ